MNFSPIGRWLILLAGLLPAYSQPANNVTAFVGASVLPMDSERVLSDQVVIVEGDRIARLGSRATTPVPAGANVIEASGKFLMPGLGEMHGHNPPIGSSPAYVESIYFLFLSNGVTTVRGMLGWPGQIELRDQVKSGRILGPTLILAGPSFSGATVTSPQAAEQRVRDQKREGWDLIKVHPGLRRDSYDAMATVADQLGLRFAGHIPTEVGLIHAIERRQETIDHLDGYMEYLNGGDGPLDPQKLASVVQLTRETQTRVVPTMVLWETILGSADLRVMEAYPELRYMPKAEVDRWKRSYRARQDDGKFDRARALRLAANRKVLLKALHDGGVDILFGTDAPQQFSVPGFSVHRELLAMVEAGLPPFAALQSATRQVGNYLKATDRFGLVAPGHRADLVLLDANPLDTIGNFSRQAGVMVRGRWLDATTIRERLALLAAAQR